MTRRLLLLYFFLSCAMALGQEDLKLISWNIRDFGKSKDTVELEQIAEIVRDADILALQEVVAGYGGAQAVAQLADLLNRKGSKWDYLISNPTESPKYATERYAFLWKTHKIKIRNRGTLLKKLEKVVDREPYLMEFYVEERLITLLNFHSRPFNKNPEAEIRAITQYVLQHLKTPLILAGDFNVDEADKVFDVLKSAGKFPAITNKKTTLKRICEGNYYLNYAIDNIFYSQEIKKRESGVIDFVEKCENLLQARKLSDHLPVYLNFSLNK
ncbi:endonuclease/exonuclease/phosphatase family protein [Muriicola sp. Z0-33]|uniref:endonuclease/exonuclease/phosphatase family protein n=1 Tax=Muriicola sp. Z0-33 TaxID=2816957 RepID=UPI0022384A54|nr:endonuclease/exonuclease/phosphatase family protein [Muriicola sp. Z0-33]MCW5516921.1 endonuclease/exonuclease/phosphatase family protein [Muriicola sp. Z0-33]